MHISATVRLCWGTIPEVRDKVLLLHQFLLGTFGAKYGTLGVRACVCTRVRKKCGSGLQRNFPSRWFLLTLPRVGVFLREGTVPPSGEPQSWQSGLFFSPSLSAASPLPPRAYSPPCTSSAPSVLVTREMEEKEKTESRHADALVSHEKPPCPSSSYSSLAQASFFHIKVALSRRRRRPVLLWRPRVLL